MATVRNDKLLFIRIPKAGGEWVVEAMQASGVDVQPASDLKHAWLGPLDSGERFTFGFVREPLSWYGSWWRHCRVIDPTQRGSPDAEWAPDRFVTLPFEDYLQRCMAEFPGFLASKYRDYLGPPESPVSFIGRYERLVDDLVSALQMAGQ